MADAAPELIRAVLALPSTAYAVVDGAHFEDVLSSLTALEIPARSLFNNRSPSAVRAGPFLAQLRTQAAREALFQFIADKPAAVFWTCSKGESILYRHLRTINMASIPGERDGDDIVLFRHYDPLVLALILPLLSGPQSARIIGPAEDIVMFAPNSGGLKHVRRPIDVLTAPTGLLHVSAVQIAGIEEGMWTRSRARIGKYLREVASEFTARMTKESLDQFVFDSCRVGAILGLRSEQAFGRWAYLMLVTGGKVAQSREVRVLIQDGSDTPDNKLRGLMRTAAAQARDASTLRN